VLTRVSYAQKVGLRHQLAKQLVKSVPVDRMPMERLRQGVNTVSLGKRWQMPQQARQRTIQKVIVSPAGLARLALKGRQCALIARRVLLYSIMAPMHQSM
jgi:hypothetical protein